MALRKLVFYVLYYVYTHRAYDHKSPTVYYVHFEFNLQSWIDVK